jgi:hypothetical protein
VMELRPSRHAGASCDLRRRQGRVSVGTNAFDGRVQQRGPGGETASLRRFTGGARTHARALKLI